MRTTIIATGTRGDVQPLLTLGNALMRRGHFVRFATEASYFPEAAAHGLECYKLSGNSSAMFSGRAGIRFREIIQTDSYSRYRDGMVAKLWSDAMKTHRSETVPPCEGADVVICQPWSGIGPSLAERFGVPAIITSPVPVLPTCAFPAPSSVPLDSEPTSKAEQEEINRRSWEHSISPYSHETIQEWRVEELRLPAQSYDAFAQDIYSAPHLFGYSPIVVPKPADWGDHVVVTGYWTTAGGDMPLDQVRDFVAAGEPPVIVSFGSHMVRNPIQFTQLVIRALSMTKRRAVLVTAGGALKSVEYPEHVLAVPFVPYDWLLPRAAALVHHGGAGTTAAALQTGCPQVVVPFGWDQVFWAQRISKLGVGADYIPESRLTEELLAAAITRAATDPTIQACAREVGELVRNERGIENAVAAVERSAAALSAK